MRGMHHYGRVVSDLDRSIAFYCGLLGFVIVVDEDLSGSEIDAQVQLSGTNMRTVMVNRLPAGPMIELIGYRVPASPPRSASAALNEIGNDHPCLLVDDIHREYKRLSKAGVRFTSPPQYIDGGYFEGDWATFCFDPDGLTLEIWQSDR